LLGEKVLIILLPLELIGFSATLKEVVIIPKERVRRSRWRLLSWSRRRLIKRKGLFQLI
jgi:hypothetical protein